MRQFLTILTVLAVFPIGASAQDQILHNRVDFSVNAQRDVDNDTLIAVVFAEVEANRQADAADEVNSAIGWATEKARDVAAVDAATLQYSTRPVYAENSRRIIGWIARQELRLESEDAEVLSTLLGELQERVAIASLSQALSREARDAIEEDLIIEALARFNRRAELIATQMGRDGYRLMSVNINNVRSSQPSSSRGISLNFAAAEMAPPEIESGTQMLSVTASGAIELNEAD